ncbi:hypothetical protein [Chlorobium sp. N1]|uniref:hypothetical protein n=1 Tax=Chlorobium sp. N1 TaxID=2491138 RepID=UPI00103EA7BE|nr:hypothetical protein [Chlorobium sp. N1]TCD47019.1 hypothetical protein E0L29_10315 [Chlorobium sp. N1]
MSDPVSVSGSAAIEVTVASVGPQGPPGADGAGVPPGGAKGQVLVKSGEGDGEAVWADPPPPLEIDGGTF